MSQRESRYVTATKIAYHLTSQVLPKYSHAKSPHHFELPQLAACVLMMFYLDLSYRDMEEWLLATDKVCQALSLSRVPDCMSSKKVGQKRQITKRHFLELYTHWRLRIMQASLL